MNKLIAMHTFKNFSPKANRKAINKIDSIAFRIAYFTFIPRKYSFFCVCLSVCVSAYYSILRAFNSLTSNLKFSFYKLFMRACDEHYRLTVNDSLLATLDGWFFLGENDARLEHRGQCNF